jgi:hypothetical protein
MEDVCKFLVTAHSNRTWSESVAGTIYTISILVASLASLTQVRKSLL